MKYRRFGSWFPALGFLFLLQPACPPLEAASPSARSKHTEIQLISETAAIAPGVPFTVALRMKMDPRWHTYWKNPGDSGLATSITWDLPADFVAGPIQWPVPKKIEVGGLVSYGYEDEIHLLVEIVPPRSLKSGRRVELKARVDWLECEEICIPGGADLQLGLPVAASPRKDPMHTELFANARSALPQSSFTEFRIEDQGSHYALVLLEASARLVPKAYFFVAEEQAVDYAAPQELRTSPPPLQLRVPKPSNAASLSALSGVLRIEGPDSINYVEVPPTVIAPGRGNPSPTGATTPQSTGSLLLFGFLGGLILNLMPCVFPVLGLKIMGLVRQSGESRARVVRHGLSYTSGVLASFWILAGILLALRAGGAQLGWGFQLQEPGFVFALAALMLVFGLNMSGVFEIGGSLIGVGAQATSQPSLVGSFLSGVLATVVATPCAAPFLAPALGAALALPALPSLALFTAIALGLASPFLLLCWFPALVGSLPKPGPWMETLKQGLAFLLYAAMAYLIWVLAGQAGETQLLSSLIALTLIAVAAWIYGRTSSPVHTTRTRRLGMAGTALVLLGGVVYGWPSAPDSTDVVWEPWSVQRVAALQNERRPIYVDFTARWCATCQVNKRVVFGSSEVLEAFRGKNVATLKADWTNQDAAITQELARWGRSAVPFNLLYLPGKPEPLVLPEVLTPQIVLDALASD
jgi:thiol:disulfide interchange protein DsbD